MYRYPCIDIHIFLLHRPAHHIQAIHILHHCPDHFWAPAEDTAGSNNAGLRHTKPLKQGKNLWYVLTSITFL